METYLPIILWFALGALVEGVISSIFEALNTTKGTLRIDQSDPEKDSYCIEIDDLDILPKKQYVVLKIDNQANLSQK